MSAQDMTLRIVDTPETAVTSADEVVQPTIRDCVERALRSYLAQLEGQDAVELYAMVLAEVETPLLQVVLEFTRNNQSRAAEVLGLNRGTLRKKLKQYDML